MKKAGVFLTLIISIVYLLNFTFGIAELPDNLPIIGNIDEFIAATLLISSLKYFGYDLSSLFTKDKKKDHLDEASNHKRKG